jgi:hypothetical protein
MSKFYGTDEETYFIERKRKPGPGRVNQLKDVEDMTPDELAYQADKIASNIDADCQRLGVIRNPWLAFIFD